MDSDVGRRVRAALVLAGRTTADVAPELNISARTLDRVVSGERQLREWELQRLAEVLAVPTWFLETGLAGAPTANSNEEVTVADLARQLHALDRRLDVEDVAGRLAALEAALTRLAEERTPR